MENVCVIMWTILFFIVFTEVSTLGNSFHRDMEVPSIKFRLRSKPKHRRLRARIESSEGCFIMVGPEIARTLPDNTTMCVYNGEHYGVSRKWIDIGNCRTCGCYNPGFVGCCPIQLVPTPLPAGCIEDPAGRQSPVPRLGACLAPLIEADSAGRDRDSVSCRDRRLRQSLAGKTWIPDRQNPGDYVMAVDDKYRNVKRAAVRRHHHQHDIASDLLYRLITEIDSAEMLEALITRSS